MNGTNAVIPCAPQHASDAVQTRDPLGSAGRS